MKRLVSSFAVAVLAVNCTYSVRHYRYYETIQPVAISERIGETIDAEERIHYGLFPGVDEFEVATFYGIEGGGYEVEILTADSKLVGVNRDYRALIILIDYIETFREIEFSQDAFERRWGIVDYDDLGFPVTQEEVRKVNKNFVAASIPYILGAGCFLASSFIASATDVYSGTLNIAIAFASVGGGYYLGSMVNARKSLQTIKEARKPRVYSRNAD
jgi:hypothetical protein